MNPIKLRMIMDRAREKDKQRKERERLGTFAPELLASLKELVAYMDDHDGYPAIQLPCVQDARRIIAKAEGK